LKPSAEDVTSSGSRDPVRHSFSGIIIVTCEDS
jgi:hypothetical protein